jgi:hypothetical protein
MDIIFLNQFWPGFASTVFGGITLTLIFFFFKEKLFSLPIAAGVWECKLTFENTGHNSYKGMQVWYKITLLQSGVSISGMGEKDREMAGTGLRNYSGRDRRTTDIYGCITKRFFGSDEIVIFWREDGEKRESTSFFKLRVSGCASARCNTNTML